MREHKSGNWDCGLTENEKLTILALARATVLWTTNGSRKEFDFSPFNITPALETLLATFVTLKKNGELRGCIGSLTPTDPLYLSVHSNAVHASVRDTRFQPVRPEELNDIHIDVSILSPLKPISSIDEFQLGQDGIILTKGGGRSVFLPEVAVEQGWNKEETLSYLSRKAGLPPNAWKEDATFKVFQSIVIGE